jgi:hypothetical protein
MKTLFVLLAVISITAVCHAETIATRYGSLQINGENTLVYKGKPVSPEIQGNNSLSVAASYKSGLEDLFVLQDNGGTGCPAQFYIVALNATGLRATSAFGTCSDLAKIEKKPGEIKVTMPGFQGPGEPASAQRRAAKERVSFIYVDGRLTSIKH